MDGIYTIIRINSQQLRDIFVFVNILIRHDKNITNNTVT